MSKHETNIPNPEKFEIIAQCTGDLDKDGKKETVVVFNSNDESTFGKARILRIFKQGESELELWKESKKALRRSEENGVKNNVVELEIQEEKLIVSCSQISNWRLDEKNTYFYDGTDFSLLEYTSKYGKDCEYWISINYSTSTEIVTFKKEYKPCNKTDPIKPTEKDELKIEGLGLNLFNRTEKYIEFNAPNLDYEWSL